ncbi:MAG: glutamyl-tRNA reductase [Candidatus Omnitrophica bacterium]|nr:glutamyl-tRNA reductase [Candidatus Omnitrophota bacterium]
MQILVVGVNHQTAPVEVRERLALAKSRLGEALHAARSHGHLAECVMLSTCNRVELYGVVPEADGQVERLKDFFQRYSQLELPLLDQVLYSFQQPNSIRHLFRVASGLDSMVIGESEVLGQVKEAYEIARGQGTTGKVFNVLFQKALNAAKEVRTQTGINRGATSVGSVAVRLAQKIFGPLQRHTILIIGAGAMGELTLRHLVKCGAESILVSNRSYDRAVALAEQWGGQAMTFEQLEQGLAQADIVISSTGAPHAVLSASQVQAAMRARRKRPLFIIDIAVPRDVESSAGSLDNVYLYNIDDLQGIVEGHRAQREEAAAASQAIIDRKVRLFMEWLATNGTPLAAGHARQPAGSRPD